MGSPGDTGGRGEGESCWQVWGIFKAVNAITFPLALSVLPCAHSADGQAKVRGSLVLGPWRVAFRKGVWLLLTPSSAAGLLCALGEASGHHLAGVT